MALKIKVSQLFYEQDTERNKPFVRGTQLWKNFSQNRIDFTEQFIKEANFTTVIYFIFSEIKITYATAFFFPHSILI